MALPAAALAALCALVCAVHFTASASMKKDLSRATANKTLELVDALKQDLRKNNDDYKDMQMAALRNPYLSGGPAVDVEGRGNALGPGRTSDDAGPASAPLGPGPGSTGASDGATKEAPTSAPPAAPVESRRSNNKFSKLHQLLDKEGLLQKFFKGLPEAGKKKYIDWMSAPARGEGGGELRARGEGAHKDMKPRGEGTQKGMKPRAFDTDEYFRPTPDTVPEADLDMLAATGEHIATLKRRGRLCHRHMLFPEGPKYDSRGKVYLPAHALAANFAATRRPKLLLPRCCNCCQKSVLGCE